MIQTLSPAWKQTFLFFDACCDSIDDGYDPADVSVKELEELNEATS